MWCSHPKPFVTRAVAMRMAEQNKLPPPDTTTITSEYVDVLIPGLKRQADAEAALAQRARFRTMIQS